MKIAGVTVGKKQQKIAIIIGLTFVAVVIILSIVGLIINAAKTATLELTVAPESAEISIDGKQYKNGVYHFEPGTYHIEIKKEGFNGFEKDIELAANKTTYLYHYLTSSDGSLDWYDKHPKDAMLLNTIGDHKAGVEAQEYLDKDPILAIVPYRSYTDGFNIDVDLDENGKSSEDRENGGGDDSESGRDLAGGDKKIVVNIELLTCRADTQEELKKAAQKYLKDHDIVLEDYDIRYSTDC